MNRKKEFKRMRTTKKVRLTVLSAAFLFCIFSCTGCSEAPDHQARASDRSSQSNAPPDAVKEDINDETPAPTVPKEEEANMPVSDSGIRVCIDPGHYEGANLLYFPDGTSYCEGEVTLQIAQKLQEILKEKYGISAYLTRDTGTVSINGYTNDTLDGMYINLRGEMAAGADLFVSIHTNANNDWANGYETCSQPIAINKPLIIANTVARDDEAMLKLGNYVGQYLTEVDDELNIATVREFRTNLDGTSLLEWTDAYNDSLDVPGTICVRTGSDGDYYGVLRGAANVGVPGFIIEHGYHTVPEVRAQIADGDLITKWAEADAKGIAEGFGLIID